MSDRQATSAGVETPPAAMPVIASRLSITRRQLGDSPLRLYPVALGCGTFGWAADEHRSSEILDAFIEGGGNFIDASCAHRDGRSEHAVGAWVKGSGLREHVLLGTTIGRHHDLTQQPARVIAHAVDTALSRLQTDYLDLLAVRIPAETCEETLVTVDDLVRSGKVRHVAADTPTADQLVEARVLSGQLGIVPLAAVQARYNLVQRAGFETGLLRMVALQNSGFLARHPLAGGILSGRQRSRQELDKLSRAGSPASVSPRRRAAILAALTRVGGDVSASVSRVALAWLLGRANVTAAVVSASDPDQIRDSLAAVGTVLSRGHVADLDRASR